MSIVEATLAATPWLALLAYTGIWIRFPRSLPRSDSPSASDGGRAPSESPNRDLPMVSVVVPARNEAATIRSCLRDLTSSGYPSFEIVVVDDRSRDGTGELARSLKPGTADRLRVVDGDTLPEGWLGKPWACWQGYQAAVGDLILFTDADTRHEPDLLERAVRALGEDGADAVTLMGRQLMHSFWEKVVQPQFFTALAIRFPRLDRILGPGRCRGVVANGQFILVERDAYEEIGGHRSIRGEVVEDLRLAQRLCRAGRRVSVREAEDAFATRMYRSLSEIVDGWSKNLSIAIRQSAPDALRPMALPLSVLAAIGLWLVPPLVLAVGGVELLADLATTGSVVAAENTVEAGAAAGAGAVPGVGWTGWSALVVGLSVFFWMGAARQCRIHPGWGILYPLGSAVACFTLIRSWLRGSRVEWKGRSYRVEASS